VNWVASGQYWLEENDMGKIDSRRRLHGDEYRMRKNILHIIGRLYFT